MRTPTTTPQRGKGERPRGRRLLTILVACLALGGLAAATAQSGAVEQVRMHELKCLFAVSSVAAAPAALQARRAACIAVYVAATDPALVAAAREADEMHQLKRLFLSERDVPAGGQEPSFAEQIRQVGRQARALQRSARLILAAN